MALTFTQNIADDECMGDSLPKINGNFSNLDNYTFLLSSQNTEFKTTYNTLVRSLTSLNTTSLVTLQTSLQQLSSLVIQ